MVALGDRNHLDDTTWRKVFVHRAATELWVLRDENGEVLDETGEGCHATGFAHDYLVNDVLGLRTRKISRVRRCPVGGGLIS